MAKDLVIFVFYNLIKINSWNYKGMPKEWNLISKNFTQPIINENVEYISIYERVEKFKGPINKLDKMYQYLDNHFSNLYDNDIISSYKILDSY